jgi:hypothetical protein
VFLKEIPFASFTNAIDMKIERVLTGFLIGLDWKGKLLDFRLVKTFFENIKAFRSYDQFNMTT